MCMRLEQNEFFFGHVTHKLLQMANLRVNSANFWWMHRGYIQIQIKGHHVESTTLIDGLCANKWSNALYHSDKWTYLVVRSCVLAVNGFLRCRDSVKYGKYYGINGISKKNSISWAAAAAAAAAITTETTTTTTITTTTTMMVARGIGNSTDYNNCKLMKALSSDWHTKQISSACCVVGCQLISVAIAFWYGFALKAEK